MIFGKSGSFEKSINFMLKIDLFQVYGQNKNFANAIS